MGGGTRLPAESENGKRPRTVPTPTGAEHGGCQQRLPQNLPHCRLFQECENGLEWKRMLIAQRQDKAVVGSGRLQLEIEGSAKPFTQSKSPGSCDAGTEWRM